MSIYPYDIGEIFCEFDIILEYDVEGELLELTILNDEYGQLEMDLESEGRDGLLDLLEFESGVTLERKGGVLSGRYSIVNGTLRYEIW